MLDYAKYIARTLQLARLGEYYVAPNPMVGAVLVDKSGKVISEGWHRQFGGLHAEVECFNSLEDGNKVAYRLEDCTLFVNLEPCSHYGKTPPCAKLIIEKGIKHVVVGMRDPNPLVAGKGIQMLRDAGVEVTVGVMEQECRELNKRFICLHEQKRPYVILKWAQTADGYLDKFRVESLEFREEGPLVISTETTKQLVHKMRAENMAILVGSGTALLDNPKLLTTRWPGRNPIRVLLDKRGRVPMDSRIFSDEAETIAFRERTDWQYVLGQLAERGIHSVLVEGGAQVLETILADGTWDEIQIEKSDVVLGCEGVKAPSVSVENAYMEEIDRHTMYTIRK